jgi:hypothetical protein
MMASHHHQFAIARPRRLDTVLADLREAVRDYHDALAAKDPDAEDRATEADSRVETLRTEFEGGFQAETGLTIEQLRQAFEGALI